MFEDIARRYGVIVGNMVVGYRYLSAEAMPIYESGLSPVPIYESGLSPVPIYESGVRPGDS